MTSQTHQTAEIVTFRAAPGVTPDRMATLAAAIRRGWVQPIRPPSGPIASATIFGSWVVLPEPVSLTTTITWRAFRAARIASRCSTTGSSLG